jgi:hypothetical protein
MKLWSAYRIPGNFNNLKNTVICPQAQNSDLKVPQNYRTTPGLCGLEHSFNPQKTSTHSAGVFSNLTEEQRLNNPTIT